MSSHLHGGSTPATALLNAAGVDFELHTYEPDPHAESRGMDAAGALGVDASTVFKTLIVSVGTSLVVAVVPADTRADLRLVAAMVGAKRARLAPHDVAERSTGYVVGGISPIGQRRRLPVFVDVTAEAHERIMVNGGRRGLMIELAPADLIEVAKGTYARLVRSRGSEER